jgi:hypothetical protein
MISDSGNTPLYCGLIDHRPHAPVDRAATIAVCGRYVVNTNAAVMAGGPVLVDEVFSNWIGTA